MATDSGGGGESASDSDALAVASAVSLCLFHDLVGIAVFLASHPLHAVYLLIFARGLVTLAAFFWPLLASTSLLLAVLATVAPYVGSAEWPGVRSLGKTCSIAVAALCAELRPDGAGTGMVGQLCSFVLGPTDAASVLRVEEIMGEPCDIAACCFLLEEEKSVLLLGGDECKEPGFALPLMGGAIGERDFLDYKEPGDLKDEIDEKVVISEDLKGSVSLDEQCCQSATIFVQEIEAGEEEEGSGIQGQGLILSAIDEVSNEAEEKRLECDPVSVEIKKSEPLQAPGIKKLEQVEPMEAKKLEIKKCEQVQAVQMKKYEPVESVKMEKSELVESMETNNSKLMQAPEVKKCEPVQELEVKKFEPVEPQKIRKSCPVEPLEIKNCERVKPCSLIAQRIKLWEAQVYGNIKPVLEDKEEDSVEINLEKGVIRVVKKSARFEADPWNEKHNCEQQPQEAASNEESTKEQQEQEFKDVKECTHSETETSSEQCSQSNDTEEIAVKVAQAEEELQQGCKDEQPEPELQEQAHVIERAEQELQEMEEVYTDVTSSPATLIESPLKSTSIAGRVHSRTSSENLVSEGSPSQKDKEWKRTLACKLYEERMQLRLCRDRTVVEGSDNMDMLWEAYEVGSGGGKGRGDKRSGSKWKSSNKVEELVDEGEKEEEEDGDEDEGSVRQLCCLQALKFSTRKMNLGGGKPSLSKISKVLRRMTALSRMGSRRKPSE